MMNTHPGKLMNRAALLLALLLIGGVLSGCAGKEAPVSAPTQAPETVVLKVAGSWPDFRALDVAAKAFTDKYPQCAIEYEYLQDYYESLEKRMAGDNVLDLFMTTNIQAGSVSLSYALDLYSQEALELSNTFSGLIDNFLFRGAAGDKARLYAVPLGAEMRGLYVNKTLLDSLGVAMPTNQATLLAACEKIKESGLIPFHGNPGAFGQTVLYPWICSLVANSPDPQATYDKINAREAGLSEMFAAPFEFMYTMVQNGYYDYKKAQSDLSLFLDASDEGYAHDFLNIKKTENGYEKTDDLGQVAFMPAPMSLGSIIAKVKDDYHSGIEYVFMPAPIGPEGGFAYLSPAHGIAVSSKSPNIDWAVRFINFLFEPENNKTFAQAFNVIPNTKDAFSYIRTRFDVPDNRICHLGQVTFDYGFYDWLLPVMTDVSKANNPKYMQDDGTGNLTLYPLSYYMEKLESSLPAVK